MSSHWAGAQRRNSFSASIGASICSGGAAAPGFRSLRASYPTAAMDSARERGFGDDFSLRVRSGHLSQGSMLHTVWACFEPRGSCQSFAIRRLPLTFIPFPVVGALALEFSAERTRGVDLAGALLPAPSPFFKSACFGVFWTLGFAPFALASVKLQPHGNPSLWGRGSSTVARHYPREGCK